MKTITAEQLQSLRQEKPDLALINTLSSEGFQKTKISGAINIPQDQKDFVKQVEKKIGGKDKTVVVYCASSECDSSTKAAEKLEKAGFDKVFDFEGGHAAWQHLGKNAPAHASASAE